MSKNKKLAIIISSSCLVIILVILSMVSSADLTSGGPGLSCATDKWTKKADFGGVGRSDSAGFSIGSKGYIGTGVSSQNAVGVETFPKDFWSWDQNTNTWEEKAQFPGVGRKGAVAFSMGNAGYIGVGGNTNSQDSLYLKDFYKYDSVTNTWAQKADFGGLGRFWGAGFSINGKGYIGVGFQNNAYLKDFWEFDPTVDTVGLPAGYGSWKPKADFAGGTRQSAVSFSIGTKGYIGTGWWDGDGPTREFWEYNPSTDKWTRKADFGGVGGRAQGAGFSLNGKGYIGLGQEAGHIYTQSFWEYDPSTNLWVKKADFKGGKRASAVGFSIGSKGYIGTGGAYLKDFWEYCPGPAN